MDSYIHELEWKKAVNESRQVIKCRNPIQATLTDGKPVLSWGGFSSLLFKAQNTENKGSYYMNYAET